ncbi:PREDICTED: uncharacterized protein LOC105313420 [Amphimedon queenslandica]|uniref:DUF3504 domain-containing protein n=2 Tax=Amphimedon queenslandica TaxID=400682 RepID=A0AAN0IP32_AMPQE|nr:PREDICTED: uncharacterized protein LOC105313420 [Amphimedon queenslandica]|eukprot:XP_011405176.1 PREDICTED: uncharacterized protein LOC105313420 [Amphimedon queenslandica]
MEDQDEDSVENAAEDEPPKKKTRLTLSLKKRFKKMSQSEVSEARRGYVPNSTHGCNNWALNNFKSLLASLKDGEGQEQYPPHILLSNDPKLLCSCLCSYVMKTRKENDDKDPNFISLHNVMDSYFRQLHGEGIEARPYNSDLVNAEEEEQLRVSRVMGIDNPRELLHAIFFYCGLNLCLRGGEEHRSLKV